MPMKEKPLVSVVIPVYNMEMFLADTLRSVLASTYPRIEVIVVNDGSTDSSLLVAGKVAAADPRVRVVSQSNSGVCRARNTAIGLAAGEYILPVDADNLIEPTFIARAVEAIESRPGIKVVAPRADFFGDRTGEWRLPPFSLHLLARKNIMDTCALYRRADWERVGGYCEHIIAREDWDFWIAVLKDGGEVVRLPGIEMHYRIRKGSKRTSDRRQKRYVVGVLNRRHPEFFERELGGPLRFRRTWSVCLNRLYRLLHPRRIHLNGKYAHLDTFVRALPALFTAGEGHVIHRGRNELREMHRDGLDLVVKSFRVPNLLNRIAYGLLRPSKARRSYDYAELLRKAGIGSPEPVAYYTERAGLLFSRSYYVSIKSRCPYTYVRLIGGGFPQQEQVLRAIARTAAAMHGNGWLHKDFSRGNILFRLSGDGAEVEIVDLNRIRFRRSVSLEEGCRNLAERLPATEEMFRILADEYARCRGAEPEECLRLLRENNEEKV